MEVGRLPISASKRGKLLSAGYTTLDSVFRATATQIARDIEVSDSEALEIQKIASHASGSDGSSKSPATVGEETAGGNMVKLSSSNYSIWKIRMEDFLYCKDLHDPIVGDSAKPSDKSDKEWEIMNRKTFGLIRLWIDDSVVHHVAKETNAHSLWMKLASLYERKTVSNKLFLFSKLKSMKYEEGSSMIEYLSSFQDVVDQLIAVNIVLDDEVLASMLLSTLPDSWESLVVSLCNLASKSLTLSTVKESLLDEESIKKNMTQLEALVIGSHGRSKHSSTHNIEKCDRSSSKSKFQKDIKCYHCGKTGHIKKQCREK